MIWLLAKGQIPEQSWPEAIRKAHPGWRHPRTKRVIYVITCCRKYIIWKHNMETQCRIIMWCEKKKKTCIKLWCLFVPFHERNVSPCITLIRNYQSAKPRKPRRNVHHFPFLSPSCYYHWYDWYHVSQFETSWRSCLNWSKLPHPCCFWLAFCTT